MCAGSLKFALFIQRISLSNIIQYLPNEVCCKIKSSHLKKYKPQNFQLEKSRPQNSQLEKLQLKNLQLKNHQSKLKILMVIPCYNEELVISENLARLNRIQDRLRQQYRHGISQLDILIINDGSDDNCAEILDGWYRENPYRGFIIHCTKNQGYGATLRCGFNYALQEKYDWVITYDMDGQHAAEYITKFIDAILTEQQKSNPVDVFSGSRYACADLFWHSPWKDRFLVNSIITSVLTHYDLHLTDSFCGMKAHRVESLKNLRLTITGYEMPLEMLLKGKKWGWKIVEIPVPLIYKNRETVLTEERSQRFIFAQAEYRLTKYGEIIKTLHPSCTHLNIKSLVEIYQHFYLEYPEISRDNFAFIQSAIDQAVKKHFIPSKMHLKLSEEEINLCRCFSSQECSPTCEIYLMCKLNN